jgi:hypothetical protein
MKLRMRHNSIRFRLTQGEVMGLCDTGRVADFIAFGPDEKHQFHYVLVWNTEVEQVCAVYEPNMIVVSMPRAQVLQWADSDEVSMRITQEAGTLDPLEILIEKDLSCLHPSDPRDNVDTYPNPQAG